MYIQHSFIEYCNIEYTRTKSAVGNALHTRAAGALTISGGLMAARLSDASPRVRVGTRLVVYSRPTISAAMASWYWSICSRMLGWIAAGTSSNGGPLEGDRWNDRSWTYGYISAAVRVIDAAVWPLAEPQYTCTKWLRASASCVPSGYSRRTPCQRHQWCDDDVDRSSAPCASKSRRYHAAA